MLSEAARHVYTWDWTLWFEVMTAVVVAMLVLALLSLARSKF